MKLTKNGVARILIGTAVLLISLTQTSPAAGQESSVDKQRRLISVLQSDAAPGEKAITCKQLAIYGDKDAVPALAPLLADKDLASWARIALEAIPGPEADEALREALSKVEGNLLIGAMNSIGVRRDARAVDALAGKLSNAELVIVEAAAVALGKIGGMEAAAVLNQALKSPRKEILPGVTEGCILCAEQFLADGKFALATQLYDAVRIADVPKQRRLEATRGAILARQSDGLPLLLEQLRSPDKAEVSIALRTARELKGRDVTEAIAAELEQAGAGRQVMLLLALADRKDDAVLPKVLLAAEKSSKPARVAALGLLDRFDARSTVPVLLNAASEADADVSGTAKATLTRVEGRSVDAALLSRLPQSEGRMKQAIIELAALRRIDAAVPAIVRSAEDVDPAIRHAALDALSTLGSEQQAGDMVRLLSRTPNAADRDAIERALTGICGRTGPKSLPQVLPLAKNDASELRIIALRALATIGGPEVLAAVTSAMDDPDESVRGEAVGTLATWPNNWPEDANVAEPLLSLVKSGKKRSYQIQGARGYLLYLQQNTKLSNADKLNAMDNLLPLLKQPQEKRLAISTLGGIPTAGALEKLIALAEDPALVEEACLGIVNVATSKKLEGANSAICRRALQTALDKSKSDSTRRKAGEALEEIR